VVIVFRFTIKNKSKFISLVFMQSYTIGNQVRVIECVHGISRVRKGGRKAPKRGRKGLKQS
jgi:hypothetical protein